MQPHNHPMQYFTIVKRSTKTLILQPLYNKTAILQGKDYC